MEKDQEFINKIQRAVDKSRVKWEMLDKLYCSLDYDYKKTRGIMVDLIDDCCGFCDHFRGRSIIENGSDDVCYDCPVQGTCNKILTRFRKHNFYPKSESEKVEAIRLSIKDALEALNRIENIHLEEDC